MLGFNGQCHKMFDPFLGLKKEFLKNSAWSRYEQAKFRQMERFRQDIYNWNFIPCLTISSKGIIRQSRF